MSRQFRIDDPAAFEALQDRWIWGVNVPLCFRRLNRQNFHDALISRLELVGDDMILEIERAEMPWAPGPVGNFRLTFSNVANGTFLSHEKEISLQQFTQQWKRHGADGRGEGWLYVGIADAVNGRCQYEIVTTSGLLRFETVATTLDVLPPFSLGDLRTTLKYLPGLKLSNLLTALTMPDVWLDIRHNRPNSTDPLFLAVACDFEFRDHDGNRSSHSDLDVEVGDGEGRQSLFEQRTRAFRAKVSAGGIVIDSVHVSDGRGFHMRFNDGSSLHAEPTAFAGPALGGNCGWWAIHMVERRAAIVVTA